jgi:maltose phosphorylase
MVNSVDWLYTRIFVDGEQLDLKASGFDGFIRILDFRDGTLSREFIWKTKSGKSLKVKFLRFLNMEKSSEGFQRIVFEPVDFSGKLEMITALDFNTIHASRRRNFWDTVKKGSEGDFAGIIGVTKTSSQRVFSGFKYEAQNIIEKSPFEDEKTIGFKLVLSLEQGKPCRFDKLVSNIVEKDLSVKDEKLWNTGVRAVAEQAPGGLGKALEENRALWKGIWDRFDIEINGDEKNQQGIRFCIFQMQQTYHGQNPANNIGAKGLTGEAYNGHAFWDTETYCLPFYLFNNPDPAKNLLEFRYSTLARAMERAKMLDGEGACYPIATLNGEEACDLWQHASIQFQPSTGVAYGIWHYVHLSGDREFLYTHGAEMLLQISRFLKSRGAWAQSTGKFGFFAVMGPDEFHMMVNNNCYTNYMAMRTFSYTLEVLKEMKEKAPEHYAGLQKKAGFTGAELDSIRECADNMCIPCDEATGIYEQHEGYFNMPHIDVDSIPVEDFPLYHNWSYDRIYRTDMIKQPDVLMFMFLYNQDFSHEFKQANYEYYEPRCIHESSLSPSIHSIFASELLKHREAFDFFGFATRLDLDNYNRNTREGLHTTSLAGAWINIVYGFGGMRSAGEILGFSPSIPAAWQDYSFKIVYRGAVLSIKVSKESCEFKVINDRSVTVNIYGRKYNIDSKGVSIEIPKGWRA